MGGNLKSSIMWKRNGNKLDLISDNYRTIRLDGFLYFFKIIYYKVEKLDEGIY